MKSFRLPIAGSVAKPAVRPKAQGADEPPAAAHAKPLTPRRPANRRPRHDRQVFLLALAAAGPAVALAMYLLWTGPFTDKYQWTLSVIVIGVWLSVSYALRERVVFPLQTLSNLLAALREGDFSIRARGATHDDPLGEALLEVNSLSETLREQRLGALEATALLRTVMAEIDVAIFTFDADQRLRLVNRAGERLLAQPVERLLGRRAEELGLADCLTGDTTRTLQMSFPGGAARWEVRRTTFRERGIPHQLLVLSDLSRALREEEREAWQRLVRVLGHELNNSLTPIKSIAASLKTVASQEPRAGDWKDDMQRGLDVIATRAAALSRFLDAYSRLARLPRPDFQAVNVGALIERVASLEMRMTVLLASGPQLTVQADGDQLEQAVINLVRNAADASLETGGAVRVGWSRSRNWAEVWVEDEGPGLSNTSNLFVPFFTTKPGGSGIGLVLSRQIAEAHGGSLTLENRQDGRGCRARIRLPIIVPSQQSDLR
ncbi:MAG TPA: ATP-binding protein [Blastocatellia bacterium]|nr:ATP-binding protein [Blastocatellia bacterium]